MGYPPQIEKLLEKYWAAETSVVEERELRQYFILHPEHTDAHTAYFLLLQEESEVEASIRPESINPAILRPLWKRVVSIAAAIALVATAGFLIQNQLSQNKTMHQSAEVYTEQDADKAYAQAKEALLLVSRKMNATQSKAAKKIHIVEPYTTILK
ncbi:MAG: hypothetical protein DRI69_02685 [Bacteroidetes bacterium]|nr:MAG: hypothetical protein DRI69_02685 [Bacteroidota bacterium]